MSARRLVSAAVVSLCALVGVLQLWSAPAFAARVHVFGSSFGSVGAGEGQFSGPAGVAVNEATGDVYVVDRGNNRVEYFSSTGTFIGQFNGSVAPTGALSSPEAIAVDNSTNPLDPSAGDVYVTDTGNKVIDKFSSTGAYLGQLTETTGGAAFGGLYGVAVDANGLVWVYQASGEIDSFSDALVNEYVSARNSPFGASPGFAVDSEDDLYVNRGAGVMAKLTSAGAVLSGEVDGEPTSAGAVDLSNDSVYVDNLSTVGAFSATGALTDRFGSGHLGESAGVAVNALTGTVYASDKSTSTVVVFTATVIPDVTTGATSKLTPASATLNGTVNADEAGAATCQFDWGTTSSYGEVAPCLGGPVEGGSSTPVSANLSGLQRDTTYHYRLQATNANGTSFGEDREFTTVGPGLQEEWASTVRADSATLSAKIDPNNAPTTYYFQYGTSASYGSAAPAPPGAPVGSGKGDVEVSRHVQGLSAASTYHYRVVAVSEPAPGETEAFFGPDQTFITQAVGTRPQLPDGRAWEMVSPPHKEGARFGWITEGIIQASINGDAFTDWAYSSTEEDPAGSANNVNIFFGRGPSGWNSQVLAPAHNFVTGPSVGAGNEYRFFSEDLSKGIVQMLSFTPLSPEATEATPYLRTDYSGGNSGEPCVTGCYRPLVSAANVPAGTKFGKEGEGGPTFAVGTPDLSHIVVISGAALTSTPTEGEKHGNLYEWSAGNLQLVSQLPEGETNQEGGRVGFSPEVGGVSRIQARHAISDDGSRIIWGESEAALRAQRHLYLRDTVKGETVRIDTPNTGAPLPEAGEPDVPVFQIASSDASRIFFSDGERLTADATSIKPDGHEDLYEFNLNAPLGARLTDLTVDEHAGEHANVGAVLGASEDGSYVYFTADGALAPGAAPGQCKIQPCNRNLYLRHDGATRFIAGLSTAEDAPSFNGALDSSTARVSPNGRWLAFMSSRSLTGYDTTDAISGLPDEEVYLYDASTSKLVCASCNPTGARPVGVKYGTALLVAADRVFRNDQWIAANIPPWTRYALSSALYQSRYLSDSGRLFFDSNDALVPQDVNATQDVYEYEPPGVGGCVSSSVTFSERSGGCVSPVSSGTSNEESAFLDASETGGDVFFLTDAKLLSQDYDNAFDIYDARECGTPSRCLPVAPPPPPPCSTGDSCKPSPSPQPAIFGSPASATFSGAGNVSASGTTPVVKPKGLTRAQKLAGALRACRRKGGKRRESCRRHARALYGAKQSRKANATQRGRG